MRKSVELDPAAIDEAREARIWYEARSPEAARAFVAELDFAIASIGETPHRWPSHGEGTRRYLMKRFPFFLVYRELEERIEVLAVAHGRRRPGYWMRRPPKQAI